MENCLVTKLKSAVNNDNLEKLGFLKMQVIKGTGTSSDRQIYFLSLTTPFTIELSEDNLQAPFGTDLDNPYTVTGNTRTYYLPNEDCNIYFDKYKNFSLATAKNKLEANVSDTYYSHITVISGTGWHGRITDANSNVITEINLSSNTYIEEFGTNDVKDFVNVTTLRCAVNCSGGDIKNLGKLTKLTTLEFKRLTGTIEEFVAAQRANGRTTCDSISCTSLHVKTTPYFNNVTFNGSDIPAPASGSASVVSWDATTITVNGTTITA